MNQGFSIIELLVTMAVFGVIVTIGATSFAGFDNHAAQAASQLSGNLKVARAKAISSTSAYRVDISSLSTQVFTGRHCRVKTWTPKPSLNLLFDKATADQDTSVCFDSRGFAESSLTITFTDEDERSAAVEVALGGAVRIAP